MTVDLNQLEVIVTQLEADSLVLGKIANDSATTTNAGEADGTVTTRLGAVVKNIQKVIADTSSTAIGNSPLEPVTGAAYTLIASDNRKYKRTNSATPVTITVDADVHTINDELEFEQGGAGKITFAAGAGMTLNSLSGNLGSAGQYATFKIKFISATVATISGNLVV